MSATRTKTFLSVQPVAERGGSDYCLLHSVIDLTQQGWTCHVVLPSPSPLATEFAAAGATLHVVPMRRITTGRSLGYWASYAAAWPLAELRIWRIAKRVDADVIHTNSLHSWYGWAVAALRRRPHLWHAREIVVQSRAALLVERLLTRYFAWRVIAISEAVAEQLPASRVEVVYDTPDDQRFSPLRAGSFRTAVGIDDDRLVVSSAGRIDTWKGFDVLLDAVTAIRRERPEVEVLIAGGPVTDKEDYATRLEARAAELDGASWLGHRSDLPELLADSDVFVLASTEPEPYGMVLAEAACAGVPIVATDQGGPREIVRSMPPGRGALIPAFDPDALEAAVLDLLPSGSSSTSARRQRRAWVLRSERSLVDLCEQALIEGPGAGR